MSNIITLKGNPISTNSLYTGRRFLTPQAKILKEAYKWMIKKQWKEKTISGKVRVEVNLYFGSKRKRDIDNMKVVYDSLTGIVIDDDSQIDELHIYRNYSKENPRVEIEIKEI